MSYLKPISISLICIKAHTIVGALNLSHSQHIAAMDNTQFLSLLLLALACGSMLPRLIHADHVSSVSRAVADVTDSNDVEGLAVLQRRFKLLQISTGDPCFGVGGSWSWVECSTDTPARITVLHLSGIGLTGSIPDFSSMDALQKIDFSLNSLTGTIPDFLGTLPNLRSLDLAFNYFSGKIPASITNNKNLYTNTYTYNKLSTSDDTTSGIPDNDRQTDYTTGSNKKSKTGVIVGILSSVFLMAGIVAGVLAIMNHNKRKAEAVAEAVAEANNAAAVAGKEMNLEMGGKLV